MKKVVLVLILGAVMWWLPAATNAADQSTLPSPQQPIPFRDVWYSTEIGFHSAVYPNFRYISDGDLLTKNRCLLFTNQMLTRYLGIMPVVPDLGLDGVALPWFWPMPVPTTDASGNLICPGPAADVAQNVRWPVLFSLEEGVWSETLGWLSDGDLLSITGFIVRTNWELINAFEPVIPCPCAPCPTPPCDCICPDAGLDAIDDGVLSNYCVGFLFSVERDFWSNRWQRMIHHGDLLSELGYVYRTNHQLMANFHPYDPPSNTDTNAKDFGLDAVYVSRSGTIWFSVEESFYDRNLGYVTDGDVLSESGRIIYRNLDLVQACSPIEDCANFGLDSLELDYYPPVPTPVTDTQ